MSQSTLNQPHSSPVPPDLPGRVLLVDDEIMVTTSIATMLRLDSQHDVTAFNSPKEALAWIEAGNFPEVVISDFLMPEMDGLSFLQAVRQRIPDTTLILLTGYADKENAIQAINEVGIYRYIEKPWDNDTLKLAIKNALERTRLITRLNEKIVDLELAQDELREYSHHLEERVTEKTHDLIVALNKLKAVVENTGDAIITLSPDGKIHGANPAFCEWVNQSVSQLDGQDAATFIRLTDQTPLIAVLTPQKKESHLLEGFVGNRPIEINLSPLPQSEGTVLVCRDIAKRREAERLREDFVSTLTHDLRTPLLAAIQTLGFFLDQSLGPITEKQADILAMLVDSNQQMLELVNVLLEVYRYEARQQKLVMTPFSLSETARQVCAELDALAQSKQQTLSINIPDDFPEIIGDKKALRRVMTNLTGNALNYTQAGGQIMLNLSHTPSTITLAVVDNGRGIPESDLAGLFQRFAQGTSRHRTTGTGLGLYLSRQIIEAHGGRIWAESQLGQGSTFTFEILRPIS